MIGAERILSSALRLINELKYKKNNTFNFSKFHNSLNLFFLDILFGL